MALNFPDPAAQTPVNTWSPDSTPSASTNGLTYVWDGEKWTAFTPPATYVRLEGDTMTGSINVPERTITAGLFDLATGPYWTCGAINIPAPANAVAGMSGLIRLTAEPTGWDAVFKHPGGVAPTPTEFPAVVPFYVAGATDILVGTPVEGIA